MKEVKNVLGNPLIRKALRITSPELSLGVDLAAALVARIKKPSIEELLNVIDKRLAELISDIATTESKYFRAECEIRALELLEILNEWDKVH